jgi:hypothetical protein
LREIVLFEGCHILLGRMRSGMQRPSCEKSRGEESYREIIEVENPRLFLDVFSVVALSHLKSSPHSPSPQSMLSVLCSLNPRGDLTALSMCHINALAKRYFRPTSAWFSPRRLGWIRFQGSLHPKVYASAWLSLQLEVRNAENLVVQSDDHGVM